MKCLLKYSVVFVFALILSSCASLDSGKLTPQEESNLIVFARNVVANLPGNKINNQEKNFIYNNKPVLNIKYTGSKEGSASLVWTLENGNSLTYKAEGKIMDFQSSFRGISFSTVSIKADTKPSRRV